MTEVTSHAPGAFCWIELATTHQDEAKEFYRKLFDWTCVDLDRGPGGAYTTFKLKERDVGAAYTLDSEQEPGVRPHWRIYIASADADATIRRSVELGGAVVAAAFDVLDFGRMAVLKDPTGAAYTVWQARKKPGIGIHNEPGAFCWGQLNTTDTAKAEAFYTALFGWGERAGFGNGVTYKEWTLRGVPIGGMMAMWPGATAPSHWLAYFGVEDCDAMAAKAATLGAKTHVPPTDVPGGGNFAVFADPQGATFAIYRASGASGSERASAPPSQLK